jgi:hypothetical protein
MMTELMNEATRQPLRNLKGVKPRNGTPLNTCRPQEYVMSRIVVCGGDAIIHKFGQNAL